MTDPWAVGEGAAAHLLHLATVLDSEARMAVRPASTSTLENAAQTLRVLAGDRRTPQRPDPETEE